MSKLRKQYKSCFISFLCENKEKAKIVAFDFIKKGYAHFYFKNSQKHDYLIYELLLLKRIYQNIQIFIVHPSSMPFWKIKNVVNLPVLETNDENCVDNWLKKYCECF